MGLTGVGGLGLSLAVHLPAQLNDFLSPQVVWRNVLDGQGFGGEKSAQFIYPLNGKGISSDVIGILLRSNLWLLKRMFLNVKFKQF